MVLLNPAAIEKLVLRNPQNIRILFFVQTIGILFILGYDLIYEGFEHMRDNPLWMLFIITSVVLAYLSMSISTRDGLLLGLILFICGLIPILYVYQLRKKQLADLEEE
ncbi:hypothetical protein ACFCVQ_27730 [Bacillus thuringiensis]|uniref:hypothetical protein n=1 Tax=Bacillus thuringiensis TaxID=1428 RepID=UPI0035D76FDB